MRACQGLAVGTDLKDDLIGCICLPLSKICHWPNPADTNFWASRSGNLRSYGCLSTLGHRFKPTLLTFRNLKIRKEWVSCGLQTSGLQVVILLPIKWIDGTLTSADNLRIESVIGNDRVWQIPSTLRFYMNTKFAYIFLPHLHKRK